MMEIAPYSWPRAIPQDNADAAQDAPPRSGGIPVERSVSQRLLQPFSRWFGTDPASDACLERLGIEAAEFVDAETRLPHSACGSLLRSWVARGNDPAIGLTAARWVQPGDLGVVEYAARHAETLQEAIESLAAFMPLLNEATTLTLELQGDQALIAIESHDAATTPSPAASDFGVALLVLAMAQHVGGDREGWTACFTHPPPVYAAQYSQVLPIPVRFGAPLNGVTLPAAHLRRRMRYGNAWIAGGFARQAERRLLESKGRGGTTGRVRHLVIHKLGNERVSMRWVASCVGVSIPTLRRRLELEGTTFSAIVASVRLELAEQLLAEGNRSVGEVAHLVGYAGIAGLNRALVRHTGVTAGVYRDRLRARTRPSTVVPRFQPPQAVAPALGW